jgi:hypothetical protein
LIVVLRRCLPLRRSSDPQLIKGRWSVDRGIDYFKRDADVNVSVVAHRQQQEEFCYLVQNGKIGPHHDGLYPAQMAQTSIVVLRRCLPLRPSRDPQLIKGRWSVDGGIDYFKRDADVNVSVVAQNFLMVKTAGRSFGRKKTTVWLSPCPCPLSPGEHGLKNFLCPSVCLERSKGEEAWGE